MTAPTLLTGVEIKKVTPFEPAYVYVASSWRNPMQVAVCAALKSAGIPHYDFKDEQGFHWSEVMGQGSTEHWTEGVDPDQYLAAIQHERAMAGYGRDYEAMERADTFVLVLPCGKSAHLELGWAVGRYKRTAILLEDPVQPELMYRMVDYLAPSLVDLLGWLGVED